MRVVLVIAAVLGGGTAVGAERSVGAGAQYPTLSAAVAASGDGDVIRLAAGTYYECAVLPQRDLLLEGDGADTVLSDTTCQGKALIVAVGDRITIRNLTLARARVPDRNGAGVRLEGQGVTLDRVRFENNQVGVLAGAAGAGTVLIRDCTFSGGGVSGERPSFAVWVGAVGRLRIERSVFEAVKGGQVSTAAAQSEVVGTTMATGVEDGAGAAITASGPLLLQDSVVALGPGRPPRNAAVVATGPDVAVERTTLRNMTGQKATLLLDWTTGTPRLAGNVVAAGDTEVSDDGLLRHRTGNLARGVVGEMRRAAGQVKRAVLGP